MSDRSRERKGTSIAGRVLRHAGLAAGPGILHGHLRRTLLETDVAEVLRDRGPASARAGCVSGVRGLELLLRCRRERLGSGQHRFACGIQGERARPHLANACLRLYGSPSKLFDERRCHLASVACSAMLRAGVNLSAGIAAKKIQGRTPRGRAGLSHEPG